MAEGTEGPHRDPDRADAGQPDDVHHSRRGGLARHRARPGLPRRQHQVQAPEVSLHRIRFLNSFGSGSKLYFRKFGSGTCNYSEGLDPLAIRPTFYTV